MTSVVATFIPNVNITDGIVVVTLDKNIVWVGPVNLTPLDALPEGARLHVHPELLARIQSRVEQVEPGGINGDRG